MYSYIWGDFSQNEVKGTWACARDIKSIVPLYWREHCLECAMPLCYKTCALYERRMDNRCLRFNYGIKPLVCGDSVIWGAEISFRRWAKLQTNLPRRLYAIPLEKYQNRELAFSRVEKRVRKFCDGIHQYRLAQIAASLAERIHTKMFEKATAELANYFVAVINNLQVENRTLIVEIISDDQSIFKTSLLLKPGWNEYKIPVVDINLPVETSLKNCIRVYLNGDETGVLQFRYFDFVHCDGAAPVRPAGKVKCVAWDLDNTLWDGVIGDIGKEQVVVNQAAVQLIKDLDRRGILQTIVSKNTYEVVWPFIEELGLAEYFLYPAINWGRKSRNLQAVARELNINIDTFALIDDSSFERNEVNNELPQVRTYDAVEIPELLNKDELDVPVTSETQGRRQSYLTEAKRKRISASWEGDYNSFLKSCEIEVHIIHPLNNAQAERCLELINRSNQYNISGNRYDADAFATLLKDEQIDCYAFSVSDKFGDYGIMGFASIVRTTDHIEIKDFVMSCRVAQKKIEKAFLNALINYYGKPVMATILKTPRNIPLQEEFRKMAFSVDEDTERKLSFHYDYAPSRNFSDEDIIKVCF